jgi:hypothetical protein
VIPRDRTARTVNERRRLVEISPETISPFYGIVEDSSSLEHSSPLTHFNARQTETRLPRAFPQQRNRSDMIIVGGTIASLSGLLQDPFLSVENTVANPAYNWHG